MAKELTPSEARDLLWRTGNIWQVLLDDLQKQVVHAHKASDRGKEIVLVLSRQTGKCLIEGTLIATPNGSVKIEDIKIGDIVYGYDANGKVVPTEVKQVHKQGKKPVVDLTVRGRVVASCTEDHRWLVWDTYNKELVVKETRDILDNKRFKIKKEVFKTGSEGIKEPNAYTLGALLGDGYCKAKSNGFIISSQTEEIPRAIADELGVYFWKGTGNNYNWNISSSYKIGKGSKSEPITINHYDDWCRGRLAHEKTCSYEIINQWDRESKLKFLAGIIDTDGSIIVIGRNKNELRFSLSMQAKDVVDTVKKLFLDLWQIDLSYTIDKRTKYKNGDVHVVYTSNNCYVKRFLSELTNYLVLERKKYKTEYNSFNDYNSNSEYTGVASGQRYEAETYDIGIDNGTHLYCLANGMVTHNSYALYTTAYCYALENPDTVVTYVAPTLKMAKKITRIIFKEITATAPTDCLARFDVQGGEYHFPNGSRIELAGFNSEQIDDARGGKSHLIIVDECGFMDTDNFEYGIQSVLYPKLNSTKGIMMMCSTLPKNPAHPYWSRVLLARLEGRCFEGTILDCPRYTKEDIDKFADRVGGYDSIDFRREYLNVMVTDEANAVIPEATPEKMNKIVKECKRPAFFDCYMSMDIGFKDYTAIVFGYYNFLTNTVVIEDEVIIRGVKVTTQAIRDAIVAKEKELWGKDSYLRVADNNNPILLNELCLPPNNLPILATAKDNREAAINKVRLLVQKESINIHPRCTYLIQQLQNATWNKRRTDFDRDVLNGHQDCLAALVYFVRNVHFGKNPFPTDYMMSMDTFNPNTNNGFDRPKTTFEEKMKEQFTPLMKRKTI